MSTCNYSRSSFFINVISLILATWIVRASALPVSQELSSRAQISNAGSSSISAFVGVVIAIASVVCLIVTLVVCLCSCFKKSTDFSQTPGNGLPMSPTRGSLFHSSSSNEFTMFPPAGSGRQFGSPDDVYFEPLPDLTTLNAAVNRLPKANKPRPVMFSHVVGQNLSFQDWFEDPYANFPRMRLRYVHELGSGWFGQIVEGEAVNIIPNEKKSKVVVKILMTGANTTDQMYFLHEVKPFRDTSHPNVLKLLGKCLESDPFLIILEHCVFGDFKNYLIKHRSESESLLQKNFLVRMAWNIAAGLQYLHNRGFILTDLAARNCLVTSDLVVKIGDYGNSIEKYKEEYYCAGGIAVPVRWCAPETLRCTETIMETKELTAEANVWSFGVVLWEVFEFGKLPYFELNDDDFIQRVIIEGSETLKRPLTPCRHMDHLYYLIQLCHSEADKRPTMTDLSELLKHIYVTEENGDMDTDFDHRWNQINSQTYSLEISHSPSSTPSLLHLEDAPLSDLSINFVDVTHSDESRAHTSDFDVDDASWKRILESSKKESGEFIKMIQEKSQSVQDLMKLTVIDIESGSESDAPCVNGEESLELSLNKAQGFETEPAPPVPNINVTEASTAVTVEDSNFTNVLDLHSNAGASQPAFRFVMKSPPEQPGEETTNLTENEDSSENVGAGFISPPSTFRERRTSTPHKNDDSYVVVNDGLETVDSLAVFFGDPHMPTLSTIDHSVSTANDEVTESDKKSSFNGTNSPLDVAGNSECCKNSLDEGLEMSEVEEDSSYSLLTATTNRSEDDDEVGEDEEDCILMVDLETNRAVLVDVPSVSWEADSNQQRDCLTSVDSADASGQSNGHRFMVERVVDNDVEEEEEIDEELDEEELSDQLVISNSSPVLMEVKQDGEVDQGAKGEGGGGESPEWEASTESVSSICTSPSATSSSSSGEFDCSTKLISDHMENNEEAKDDKEDIVDAAEDQQETLFHLSTWDKDAVPSKGVLRSYNRLYLNEGKKTVSFYFPNESLVYEYPKEENDDDFEEEEDEYNGIFDGDYENAYYADNSRPNWSYVYDDSFADYSTIADWDLGAEEMPDLEDVDNYEDEDDLNSSEIERESMAKKPRPTWGAIYKLSDLAYDEEEDDDDDDEVDEDIDKEPNGRVSFQGQPAFDIASYFAQYNPDSLYMDGVESMENHRDGSPVEEQDENYWLQRIINNEDLIENTECPFDENDEDDIEEEEESDKWDLNATYELNSSDNGLQSGVVIKGTKHNGHVEVNNEQEIKYKISG